jgi:hypothetical protein
LDIRAARAEAEFSSNPVVCKTEKRNEQAAVRHLVAARRASESRAIADEFLDASQRSDPSVEVDLLDLWNERPPAEPS